MNCCLLWCALFFEVLNNYESYNKWKYEIDFVIWQAIRWFAGCIIPFPFHNLLSQSVRTAWCQVLKLFRMLWLCSPDESLLHPGNNACIIFHRLSVMNATNVFSFYTFSRLWILYISNGTLVVSRDLWKWNQTTKLLNSLYFDGSIGELCRKKCFLSLVGHDTFLFSGHQNSNWTFLLAIRTGHQK